MSGQLPRCSRQIALLWVLITGGAHARDSRVDEPLALVMAREPGFTRVAASLVPESLHGSSSETLGLVDADGQPQLLAIDDGGDGTFDNTDAFVFFCPGPQTPSGHWVGYRFGRGLARRDLPERASVPQWSFAAERPVALSASSAASPSCPEPIARGLVAIAPGTSGDLTLDLPPGRAPGEWLDLVLTVAGRPDDDATNDLRVSWGEGEGDGINAHLTGREPGRVEIRVPATAARDGTLVLAIANRNPIRTLDLLGKSLDGLVVTGATLVTEVTFTSEEAAPRGVVVIAPGRAPKVEGADWVALTPRALATPALERLARHRSDQGLRTAIITLEDLAVASGGRHETAAMIRSFLAEAHRTWTPAPRYVVIVGDDPGTERQTAPYAWVPTLQVDVLGNGASPSDVRYGDLEDDGTLDLSVGRLAVRTAAELDGLVERLIAYETSPPPGEWRRRVSLVFGEGRFGAARDRGIETMATALVATYLPPELDVDVAFASASSPYLVAPSRFDEHVRGLFARGAYVLAYVGHGSPRHLDELRWRGQRYPILDAEAAAELDTASGPPLVFLLACSTGHLDGERPCLAETMIAAPRGPVAVLAASRVSYPYANGVLAKELIDAFLREPAERLGDGIDAARRRLESHQDPMRMLIDAGARPLVPDPARMLRERRDQVWLYNLFGDPAMRLARPRATTTLEAPEKAKPGERVLVAGVVSLAKARGAGEVTLEVARTVIRGKLQEIEGLEGEQLADALAHNHATATDKVVERFPVKVSGGSWDVKLELPADLSPGEYTLKIYVEGETWEAFAARKIQVEARKEGEEYF